MSKSIASYPKSKRQAVISARLNANTGGLGYWAAIDAEKQAIRNALIEKGQIKPAS